MRVVPTCLLLASLRVRGFVNTHSRQRVCRTPLAASWAAPDDDDEKPINESNLPLHFDPARADLAMSFGKDDKSLYEEQADGTFTEDYREIKRRERKAKIAELLRQQDEEFRRERKKKNWGDYANVTNADEMAKVAEAQTKVIEEENTKKAELAKAVGVDLTMLEPEEPNEESPTVITTSKTGTSIFEEVDEELKDEWSTMGDKTGTTLVDGKVMSKDALKGIRVGSAGGWSLEVFPGDFVVHRKYGIGRFDKTCLRPKTKLTEAEKAARNERRKEIVRQELRKQNQDASGPKLTVADISARFGTEEDKDPISNPQSTVLEIAYADGIVHVPVDRAYRLSRYRAGDSAIKPKLSKVRGDAWKKAKQKVEENTLELAQDVLALYATREMLRRPPFDPSKEALVKKFEETFAYEPTPDQKTCFEAVENDMVWRNRPMDRLICGDVGFGKTEVALRALFRTVINGRQGALLAPTGVLAAQHFKNVVARMGEESGFNVSVALLRGGMGRRTKAGREMREKIESGEVQLVVGTHALLSNDLSFKDLGLLVVDEEQRFGVRQKERLKVISEGVDVLTMTATPIPRTLQMSLSGIRDTSTIRSPPPMRKPTVSYVREFNEEVVREAIGRELERGGQCFYVVPRIAMLGPAENLIRSLFPEVRVIQAHGRMARNEAEDNVATFAEGNFEVLLATTVIENGVDIPSVNTIIIQNAQNFGMSTLYQLRGRVGRSDKQAFAYFLHREDAVTEQAAMRLQAMGDLQELGSGFDVASRDLEIRGAGSLLGTEQSGLAARVGFDLYMRMLKKSVRQLKGLDLPMVPRTNILFPEGEGSIEIKGPGGISHAFRIPEDFIADETERKQEESIARLAESTAELVELTNKWKKDYGVLPKKLQLKLKTMHLHACTRRLGIDLIGLVDNGEGRIDCILRSPGLRPRHLASICPSMPKGVLSKGLDAVFPGRFTKSGEEDEIRGGIPLNLEPNFLVSEDEDDDVEDWDSMDQEEVEAMKEIASAFDISSIDDIDLEQYPRFVIKNFGKIPVGQRVDALLKVLLSTAKVVYDLQEKDKEAAKVAAELREKRERLKRTKKSLDRKDRIVLEYN